MKILTDKQYERDLMKVREEMERRFYMERENKNLLEWLERMERRIFDLEMKVLPQEKQCGVRKEE